MNEEEDIRGGATDEQINQAYKERLILDQQDPRTDEKFLEERAKKKEEEEKKKGLLDEGSAFRTTAAIGTEIGLNTILDMFSFVPPAQVSGGAFINYLAQRIRGGEISKGEMSAAGLASLIPGGAQGKALTKLAKSTGKGAVSGGIEVTGQKVVDEGRLPTAGELGTGLAVGGAFGGIFQTAADSKFLKALGKRVNNPLDNAITVYAAKPATGVGPSFVDPDGQGQLLSPTQQAKLTIKRPPGMTLAAFNALKQGGMLVDVMPISNAADISEFSRGFVSALTNPNFGIGNFVVARNAAIRAFGDKYYQLTKSVARPNFLAPELDHTTPLKVTGHILFPGSTRKQIKEYIDILYDNGLYAGDDPANLRLLPGEVHQVATNWVTVNLGRHGQLFLQKMGLLNLPRTPAGNYTHGAKKQIAKLYAKEVKQLKNKVSEAYEQFDLLYDFSTPGLGGYRDKLDQFVDVLTRVDPDSPVTLQSIRDIATGAAEGTPYIFENLTETIENLRQARLKGAQAFDNLFRLEQTGAPDAQIQAAQRAANRFMNEADDLQLMLSKLLKATIE